MRTSVRTFGTFRGNMRSGYPGGAALKLDADRRTDRPERRDGGREDLPPEDPHHASARDEDAEDDPPEPVDPAQDLLGVMGEAADPPPQERRKDRGLDGRVEPHQREVPHGPSSLRQRRYPPVRSRIRSVPI